MGYIYKITNTINGKCYVGQTKRDISIRFRQHIRDSKTKDYVLYRAMRRYGVENFKIELIEKSGNKILNEREMFWIKKLKSNKYKYGYNMTIGGETSSMVQSLKVKQYTLEGKYVKTFNSVREASYVMGAKSTSINFALNGKYKTSLGYQWRYVDDNRPIYREHYGRSKKVYQYDLNGNFIKEHLTIKEAEIEMNGKQGTTILQCCKHKHKTAYGFQWSYDKMNNIGKCILLKSNQFVKLTAI